MTSDFVVLPIVIVTVACLVLVLGGVPRFTRERPDHLH
jgi:hypothetical protein